MKIVVTGAAGFIGSHLSERLSDMGHEVVGIDAFTPYYDRALKELNAQDIRNKNVKLLELDLSEAALSDAVSDADFVFHLAAQPGISADTTFDIYLKNNFLSTYKLLETLKDNSRLKCFFNISTSSVYGENATGSERRPPTPTSYYGVTKLAAEQLVLSYQRDKGFPACSLRLFSVYGERERPEKLYPKLIRSIIEEKPFPLFVGSEKHLRSYTYVGDILDGLIAALENYPKCIGQAFNIGCDTAITTGEGIRLVEDMIGKKAIIELKPKRAGDQLKTHADITKARRILGYEPKVLPAEGLEKEVKWFKEKFYAQ
ncbi:MAG: NAD-dependent epimerase/dehydratase family protein [Patescibacteria group bacterium]|jgi:nucleoside-diphosphate-sugar epimerase